MNSPVIRTMPSNEEAEQALIGALLNDNEKIDQINSFFLPKYFFNELHAKIYSMIERLSEKGISANPLSLKKFLESDEVFKVSGISPYEYLVKLVTNAQVILNVRDLAVLIHELAVRRELIRVGEDVVNTSYKDDLDISINDRIEKVEHELFNIASVGTREYDFLHINTSISNSIHKIEYLSKNRRLFEGIPTKFDKLDELIGGMQSSDLLIVAARPSMGKTAFAIKIGLNAAEFFVNELSEDGENEKKKSVAIISLEMSAEQIVNRILSIKTGLEGKRIRTGKFNKDELKNLIYEAGNIKELPIFIDDTPALSISTIKSRVRRMKRQHNIGLLIVDYLQLVRPSSASQNRSKVEQIGEISQGFKEIAKELDIPVIALSQLSRAVELRVDKKPQLSDLRDSGNIEQDADVVMFLYREEYYLDKKTPIDNQENMEWQEKVNAVKHIAEIIVAKQRNGPTGNCFLRFDNETTNFQNMYVAGSQSM